MIMVAFRPRARQITLVALLAASVQLQAQTEESAYGIEPVTESLHLLRNPDSPFSDNVLVSTGPDGILLIDDAYEETAVEIRRLIGELQDGPVDVIINTHYHHAGANDVFGSEALVVAHRNTRVRMRTEQSMYGMRSIGPWSEAGLPDITFDDEMTLHYNGDRVDLLHLPSAHTDGDVVVFFRNANVVATGDVFVPMLAVCDFTSGCVWDRFVEAVGRLVDLIPTDATIVPGHGPISDHSDLRELSQLLDEVTAKVEKAMAAGATEEEVVAAGLSGKWRHWADRGLPVDFFLGNVYRSIAAGYSE